MPLLAFETSCDETSAAVVHQGRVRSNVVSSQIQLHAEYGGVVPELAAREHLRNLLPVAGAALRQAGITAGQVEAVAATQGPGLPGALMVGLKAAQGVAFVLRRSFLGIQHHEAHLYSPWITGEPPSADFSKFEPNVSLIVSGGHTMLVHVEAELRHRLLGSTVDDAAGECFDKAGKLMGLPYPAGPEIDRLAGQGNPEAYDFPRPMLNEMHDDFSFSGLKTSIRYFLRDRPELLDDPQKLRDLCASVQAAIVEVLVTKTIRAARRLGVGCVTASGGVTCNRVLRQELEAASRKAGLNLRLAERALCTDNAAMIGILAERKLQANAQPTALDADILPGWGLC
ncbi:MAG TPA: tRNA (adenosine(37)-N6)-threonylcarbamoyltransferase complex transferase subunit TsaD [Candidatus Binatia bacterium]|jgi:N6-L-threonylcarbamoyladenine synthase|nr:tRNA (adenosine(37)-N6)-threonylcarbamoyltransferase complex transferase subunit TsaD [Candidatus Binatia bacterium]